MPVKEAISIQVIPVDSRNTHDKGYKAVGLLHTVKKLRSGAGTHRTLTSVHVHVQV